MVLQGASVLVVEDEPDVRLLLMILLQLEGAEVGGVGTGREALALCRKRRFDIMLSDLGLPDIPGDAVIRAVRALPTGPSQIAVITGENESSFARSQAAGADAVFRKPVEWEHVLDYLRTLNLPRAA